MSSTSRHFGRCRTPLGHVAGRPSRRRSVVPALGQEQPPVQRAAGLLGDGVDRHPELAVGRLAQRPRVLALHPHRWSPSLGKPVSSTAHAVGCKLSRPAARPAGGGPAASPTATRPRSGAAPGSAPHRPGERPSARSTCAARPASARAGSTGHGHAGPCAATTRRCRPRTPPGVPRMAANSAGVMPANSSPPLEPEGGSTHTPPARRKPDRVLLVLRSLMWV